MKLSSRSGSRFTIPIIAIATIAALAACSTPSSEKSGAQNGTVTIAFVPGSTTSQFYVSMKTGAEKAAKKLGVKLVYQGAADFSPADQTPIINALAAQKLDGLVVAPTDQESMFAPINALHGMGVKIVTVDTALKDTSIVTASVTASNRQGGEIAADQMAKLTNGKTGSIAVLGLNPGATTINERAAGFAAQIKEKYSNLTVLPTEYVSGTDAGDAQTKTEALLLGHPDIVGVFAPNQPGSDGAAAAMRAQNKTGIPIIGYDSSDSQVKLLKSGAIAALILQQPALEGELAVEAAYAAITGGTFKKEQLLDNFLATTENSSDPAVSKYFY